MIEYYVVRDKNTGLYFRGKGANRWGKYYNQASIYRIKANAESAIKHLSYHGEQAEIVPIHISENAVDADEVVRCKDCKHWSDGVAGCTDHVKCCKIGFYMVGENGYCVYGERKTITDQTMEALKKMGRKAHGEE